jgi:serine/threonine protein kinase
LKHTPLHPHHPLISARLLREPTLLAGLAPHPCLIGIESLIRTEGHFYLIGTCTPLLVSVLLILSAESYASNHVPLPDHPLPLLPSRAAKILDQLVSVLRDCLHEGRVCHRDLKGENVLVDVESGQVVLIGWFLSYIGLTIRFGTSY